MSNALRLVLILALGIRAVAADPAPAPAPAPDAASPPAADPAKAATPAHGKITGHITTIVTPGSGGPAITVTPGAPTANAKPAKHKDKDAKAKEAKGDDAKDEPTKPLDLHVGDGVAITIDGAKATFDDLRIDDQAVVEYDGTEASKITVTRAPPSKKAKPAAPPHKK